MTHDNEQPVFTGTPDRWWENAEPITEAEAADRDLSTWYIVAESRAGERRSAYRISTTTRASNEARKAALARKVAMGAVKPDDIAPNVRALLRVPVEEPEWMAAELVMADRAVGSDERALWRRTPKKWHLVHDGRVSVGEQTMAQLHPVIATITVADE